MVNITLFELHLEGAQFTANAPYSGASAEAEPEAEGSEIEIEDDESTGGVPFGLLVVLGVFSAVISFLVAKKAFGGGESEDTSESEDMPE